MCGECCGSQLFITPSNLAGWDRARQSWVGRTHTGVGVFTQISTSLSVSMCIPVSLSLCMSLSLSQCISLSVSMCTPVSLSSYISLSLCPHVPLSLCLRVCPCLSVSMYIPVSLSLYISLYFSLCVSLTSNHFFHLFRVWPCILAISAHLPTVCNYFSRWVFHLRTLLVAPVMLWLRGSF